MKKVLIAVDEVIIENHKITDIQYSFIMNILKNKHIKKDKNKLDRIN